MNILLSFVVIVIHFIHIISIQYIQYIQYIHIECLQTWHSTRSRLLAIESSSTGFDTFRIVPEATTMLGRGYPFPKAADFSSLPSEKNTHGEFTARCSGWSTTTCLRTYWNICASSFFVCALSWFRLYQLYQCYNLWMWTITRCESTRSIEVPDSTREPLWLSWLCSDFPHQRQSTSGLGGINWDAAKNREPGWKHDEHVWKLFTFIQAFIEFHPFSRLFFI